MQLEVDRQPKELAGYQVLSHLGDGAASSIFAAADPKTKQIVALKRVVRKDEKSQRYIDQLANELDICRKIGPHENIRQILDLKLSRTLLRKVTEAVLVMEMVDAASLERELRMRGHADIAWIFDVLLQTARAMATINAAGIVHADMKPENIMVLPSGKVKVIDLGQACPNGTEKERVQGTPFFMAPEQMERDLRLKVTYRTDVFNFGATMYWALTGKFVPTEFARKKGLAQGKPEDAPPPHNLNPAIPADLSALVMQCVHTKMMERPESMKTVAARMEAIRA
jgi:serine/threonine-protein kinase